MIGAPAPIAASAGRRLARILLRCCSVVLFILVASFVSSVVVGLVAIAIGSLYSSSPVSVPAACRILSSNVDIRSSKVCELGLLNFKANHVFYTSSKTGFRCRYDYYWSSVFEVEYREYFSGQILHAVAEAPKEALPIDCRPSFGTAWSNKMRFKVNETYSCRYTPGSPKAEIDWGDIFGCQAKDPSMAEIAWRFFILLTRTSYSDMRRPGRKALYAVAGAVSGMLVSMCLVILAKCVQVSAQALARRWHSLKPRLVVYAVHFRRLCLFVAYFSAMGWLTLQYGQMIGLRQLWFDDKTVTR